MNSDKNMRFTFILLLFFALKLNAQTIQNVDFTVNADRQIEIIYDLVDCKRKEVYNIKLEIESEKQLVYNVFSYTGDIKNVEEGRRKKIIWDAFKDNPDGIKDKISIKVIVESKFSTKITGGPRNVFLSMLMPGLGDLFVNDNKDNAVYPFYAFIGAVGITYYSKYTSDYNYDLYHNMKPDLASASDYTKMNDYYTQANDYYQLYQVMIGVSAAIWLGDVIYVLAKGSSNKRKQLQHFTQYNYNKINLKISPVYGGVTFGLTKNF